MKATSTLDSFRVQSSGVNNSCRNLCEVRLKIKRRPVGKLQPGQLETSRPVHWGRTNHAKILAETQSPKPAEQGHNKKEEECEIFLCLNAGKNTYMCHNCAHGTLLCSKRPPVQRAAPTGCMDPQQGLIHGQPSQHWCHVLRHPHHRTPFLSTYRVSCPHLPQVERGAKGKKKTGAEGRPISGR